MVLVIPGFYYLIVHVTIKNKNLIYKHQYMSVIAIIDQSNSAQSYENANIESNSNRK